jgi:Ca-activated chloride channel family protein
MRPQWGSRKVDVVRRGIDMVFVVDTSKSMLAEDIRPNRIERVRRDLRYFVDSVVQQDRIALVAFAGTARTLCPLTLDRGAFEIFLDELDVGVIPVGGTDLTAALDEGLAAFGDDLRNHKAIVLFSDGEAHEGLPEDSLEEARRLGVRIYTIGIGDERGVRIPVEEDGRRTFLKDADGDIVLTRLDDRTLKTIAQRSLDGAYMHLASGRDNLERIYLDNIKKIEERELRSLQQVRRLERFQWIVGGALILLMTEAMLAEGRRRRRRSLVGEGSRP